MVTSKKFAIILLSTFLIGGFLLKTYGPPKADIMLMMQDFAVNMRNIKCSKLLMSLLASVLGIPPMLGFTFAVTMSGFIYGFPNGSIPAMTGAVTSAMISFGLIHKLQLAKRIKFSTKRQEMYQAIQDAITQGGFKMILLIRICPLPWQLTNLVLSLIPAMTWQRYLISTLIACFKFNMDVWVGSQLANLSDPDLPQETHRATLMYMSIGLFMLISSGIWIYKMTMIKIKEQQEKLLESGEFQQLLFAENSVNDNIITSSSVVGKSYHHAQNSV